MSSRGSHNDATMIPWRPPRGSLEAPWSPSGGQKAPRAILERFWMPFGRLWGPQNCLQSMLKWNLKSSNTLECHFGPLGSVLGSIVGSFWDRFGLCLAVRPPNTKTLIFDDLLTRNRVFSGPGGSRNPSKIAPDSLRALNLAPKASWRLLGLDFGVF